MSHKFYEKNKIDLDLGTMVTITITDAVATDNGQDFVDYLRNRRNDSGWATSGSTNAALTQIDVLFGESHSLTDIMLIQQNFKAYTVQYWNGSAWTDFSTTIAVTGNTDADKYHSFTAVETDRIRIIVTETFVVDDDKFLAQLIVTELIGAMTTEPIIQDVDSSKNRRTLKNMSGKGKVIRSEGSFSFKMKQEGVVNLADQALMESLHNYHNGFLVSLGGGTITQFRDSTPRVGWRKKDLFVMNISSEYSPEWFKGRYNNGLSINATFIEVI